MRLLKYFSILIAIIALVFYLGKKTNRYQTMNGETMGTYYSIKIKTDRENNLLHNVVKAELERINNQMSVFDPTSELSLINQFSEKEWIEMSPELSDVMKTSHNIYQISNGNFDPTVGKLIDLWGFGVSSPKKIPTPEEISTVLKYSNFNQLKFSNNFQKIKKNNPHTYINLSAIAKGYGVDRISKLLSKAGYNDYIIEIGGEVVAKGRRDEQTDGWNVGVSKPSENGIENAYIVTLKDYAVATSGDYRNFLVFNDKRYSHTISPKTGYPVEHNLASVTVFHKKCMSADAYATALMSMGENKALNFANNNNLAVILFVRDNDNNIKAIISNEAKKIIGE